MRHSCSGSCGYLVLGVGSGGALLEGRALVLSGRR